MPRRSARLKIPAQAFGDKEYFSGTFSCKIADKKQAPAPLCCAEILGVVHAPSEINSDPSYHPGVCPPSRIRHWNFGLCERLQHSRKVTSSCGRQSAGDVLEQREPWVSTMCRLPHFINYPYGLHEKAAPFVRQPPALARHRKPLTRAAECHDVHRREFSAVELGHVPGVGHIREMPLRHRHAGRDDLACPQGCDIVKRSGVGKAPYAVEK